MNGITWTRVAEGDEIEVNDIRADIGAVVRTLNGALDGAADIEEGIAYRNLYRPDVYGWPLDGARGAWCHVFHAAINATAPSTADGTDTTAAATFTAASLRDDWLAVQGRITVTPDCIRTRATDAGQEQYAPIPGTARRINLFDRTSESGETVALEIEARLSVYLPHIYVGEGATTVRRFGYPPVKTVAEAPPYASSDGGRLVARYQRIDVLGDVEEFTGSRRELYSNVLGDLAALTAPDAAEMLARHAQLYNVELYSYADVDPGVYRVWLEWLCDEDLANRCQGVVFSDVQVTIEAWLEG